MSPLGAGVLAGQRRAIARALTVVDRGGGAAAELLRELFPHAGRARVVGVTGAPGVGKSTLVDALALAVRARGETVGIIAVDPSSPFSGGAILGDRIRMQDATMDAGVFMRSLASRGQTGGLSRATAGTLEVLDAAGFQWIFVETVGAGQSEIEIMELAQTVLVVLAPGLGDDIQAIKAGILEIADIFVVNKADREGADRTVRELEAMLNLVPEPPPWRPEVVRTVAQDRQGVDTLLAAIERHHGFLTASGRLGERRRRQAEALVRHAALDALDRYLRQMVASPEWRAQIDAVIEGTEDAATVARWVLRRAGGIPEGQIGDGVQHPDP
jgi:LAO/AO transport system kinase